ncbi:ParB/RepB/Spo0J family partition protein [Tenggerimyces flavus]|uniref:ParB/RepB/Spo0J family partition protein n=1 Tax=Tenggerimyces flavus TaxID=1708749 RepID=A0ABV7YKU2_9ACTN|nr:ParB/RepB/Spo0J family partition protein [Tenggerimyces flavus]MBM7789560.1 ParB family chromosome partitioning protein [Tenggerimyces flavus]
MRQLRLDQLVVSRLQVRTREVEKDLEELVENIRVHGQLEPIVVAPIEGPSDEGAAQYEIVAGQRRFLALQRLNQPTILAAILEERADEATTRALSISENLMRRGLSSKDLIDACTSLYHKYGSIKAVSEELALPYSKVRAYIKFERLRPELKNLIQGGTLDVRTAIRIEDHFGEKGVDESELENIAKTLSRMTTAQQIDFLSQSARSLGSGVAEVAGKGKVLRVRPGGVKQILVTLREEQYMQLRSWASRRGFTQDRAAAQILAAFLGGAVSPNELKGEVGGSGVADGQKSSKNLNSTID